MATKKKGSKSKKKSGGRRKLYGAAKIAHEKRMRRKGHHFGGGRKKGARKTKKSTAKRSSSSHPKGLAKRVQKLERDVKHQGHEIKQVKQVVAVHHNAIGSIATGMRQLGAPVHVRALGSGRR
jgi:hypothetical protein